jgi:hypothetical protein
MHDFNHILHNRIRLLNDKQYYYESIATGMAQFGVRIKVL